MALGSNLAMLVVVELRWLPPGLFLSGGFILWEKSGFAPAGAFGGLIRPGLVIFYVYPCLRAKFLLAWAWEKIRQVVVRDQKKSQFTIESDSE
jgi:hypothetical protein